MAKKKEMTLEQLEKLLFELRSEKIKENIVRMGVPSQNVIGVATDEIRKLAKKIVKDDDLAYKLWKKIFMNIDCLLHYYLSRECQNMKFIF